jgi:integrase
MKTGYWSHNKYYRLNVKDYVESFCGWDPLKQLVSYAGNQRNQAFISSLFLTGGRVSEVLSLKRQNFEIRQAEGIIIVRNMKLLKRYRKVKEVKVNGQKKWITEKLFKTRNPFPISTHEPLTPMLLEWLNQTEDYLFPSPYKIEKPLSRFWAYKLIRKIDKTIPQKLREQLGLNKPFIVNGKKISDTIHLWLHYFRSQRASQLVSDYGYEVIDLIDYFSWEKYETAFRYAKQGWKGLASKMKIAQVRHA